MVALVQDGSPFMSDKIFTGQEIVGQVGHPGLGHYDLVRCSKCNEPVSMGVAWFDAYGTPRDTYVHYSCLSERRLNEIAKEKEVQQ